MCLNAAVSSFVNSKWSLAFHLGDDIGLITLDNEGATTKRSVKITIQPLPTRTIRGVIEKGPFSLGGEIVFSLLFDDRPTPVKEVSAMLLDSLGRYTLEVNDNSLYSVEAKGQFYNEISGLLVEEELALRALLAINEISNNNYNINMLYVYKL